MKTFIVLAATICLSLMASSKDILAENKQPKERSFAIDWDNDTFLMDGEPFRFVAGSFHYFRALPETWRAKLRTMRAAGLNAVTTYVEWALHNPKDGVYVWDGIADLVNFIELAQEEDLYVILRPGPYICAEREMGGFPYWLLNKYPNVKLRTYDEDYMEETRTWYDEMMPRITPYLYGNGGPIIMVQVENEYGSFFPHSEQYKSWLNDLTDSYVQDKAVLFTNDAPEWIALGKIKNVLATLDFGPGSDTQIRRFWNLLRLLQPRGPLVNIEYYPGWFTNWQEDMKRSDIESVTKTLRQMLQDGASVNFYMFYGGTNFGFTSGANLGSINSIGHIPTESFYLGHVPQVTSYDYDSPMDEAGDPTPKWFALRDVIAEFLPLPNITVPEPSRKMKPPPVKMTGITSLLSNYIRRKLGSTPVVNKDPLSFEALNQFSGLVLYETPLPDDKKDPSLLTIDKLNDRALVYVDQNFVGIMSRGNKINSLSVPAGLGRTLQILVENQGRINFGILNDFKGILSAVQYNGKSLTNFTMTGFPLESVEALQFLTRQVTKRDTFGGFLKTAPTIFYGEFVINSEEIYDTYFDPTGWGKGVVFINGFNLGRYWPLVGPQITLYVPKEILKQGVNQVIMIEYQRVAENEIIKFADRANLDGL